MSGERLITADEAAKMFGVKKHTWWQWRRVDPDCPSPAVKRHMLTRWRLSDVEAYMEKMIEKNQK